MNVRKLAGLCLVSFGVINVLHEVFLRGRGMGQPGIVYTVVTAIFFTAGAALFFRTKIGQRS